MESVHVIPVDDIYPHKEDGFDCHCSPRLEEKGLIVVHNSFDGRELIEDGNQHPAKMNPQ